MYVEKVKLKLILVNSGGGALFEVISGTRKGFKIGASRHQHKKIPYILETFYEGVISWGHFATLDNLRPLGLEIYYDLDGKKICFNGEKKVISIVS